jgi:vitamin B12 transporter
MLQKSFLAFYIGCAFAGPLCAQEAALQPTVEVTASRVAETVDASLADVSIITRS